MRARLQSARQYFIQATDELRAIQRELAPGIESDLRRERCQILIDGTCAARCAVEAMIVEDVPKLPAAEPILPAQSASRSQKSHAR